MHPLRHESYAPQESHLSVVCNDDTTFLSSRRAAAKLPDFEGKVVLGGAFGKITSVGKLDLEGVAYQVDEIVKIVIDARIGGVYHEVDEQTGKLQRVHKLKALDAVVVDWNLDLDALRGAG